MIEKRYEKMHEGALAVALVRQGICVDGWVEQGEQRLDTTPQGNLWWWVSLNERELLASQFTYRGTRPSQGGQVQRRPWRWTNDAKVRRKP